MLDTIRFYVQFSGAFCKATYKRFGDEGLKIIRNVASQFGDSFGKAFKNRAGSSSAEVIAEAQNDTFRMLGWKMRYIPADEGIKVVADECPAGLANTCWELCDAFMDFARATWRAIDPNVEFYIDKTLAVGDSQCLCRVKKGT